MDALYRHMLKKAQEGGYGSDATLDWDDGVKSTRPKRSRKVTERYVPGNDKVTADNEAKRQKKKNVRRFFEESAREVATPKQKNEKKSPAQKAEKREDIRQRKAALHHRKNLIADKPKPFSMDAFESECEEFVEGFVEHDEYDGLESYYNRVIEDSDDETLEKMLCHKKRMHEQKVLEDKQLVKSAALTSVIEAKEKRESSEFDLKPVPSTTGTGNTTTFNISINNSRATINHEPTLLHSIFQSQHVSSLMLPQSPLPQFSLPMSSLGMQGDQPFGTRQVKRETSSRQLCIKDRSDIMNCGDNLEDHLEEHLISLLSRERKHSTWILKYQEARDLYVEHGSDGLLRGSNSIDPVIADWYYSQKVAMRNGNLNRAQKKLILLLMGS